MKYRKCQTDNRSVQVPLTSQYLVGVVLVLSRRRTTGAAKLRVL